MAAAKDGDRTLIAVLLKTDERKDIFLDAKSMFEAAFSQPKIKRVLLRKGPQKFNMELPGAVKPVACYLKDDVALEYYPAEEASISCMVVWDSTIEPPVVKDQWLGTLTFLHGNDVVYREDQLYAVEDVGATWGYRFKTLFGVVRTDNALIKLAGALAIGLVISLAYIQVKRNKD